MCTTGTFCGSVNTAAHRAVSPKAFSVQTARQHTPADGSSVVGCAVRAAARRVLADREEARLCTTGTLHGSVNTAALRAVSPKAYKQRGSTPVSEVSPFKAIKIPTAILT